MVGPDQENRSTAKLQSNPGPPLSRRTLNRKANEAVIGWVEEEVEMRKGRLRMQIRPKERRKWKRAPDRSAGIVNSIWTEGGKQDGTRGRYHGGRRPSSDDSSHSPTVIPPSALDKPSIMKRYHSRRTCSHTSPRRLPSMVTLHDTRFVEC